MILYVDKALRRICDFPMRKKLPHEANFSRAFAEFAEADLAGRAHESLIKKHLGDSLIGHISRDATAIETREKPKKKELSGKGKSVGNAGLVETAEVDNSVEVAVSHATLG